MSARLMYLHGFCSGAGSTKAQFFRRRFADHGIGLEIPALDAGHFENLTITSQLQVIERTANGGAVSLIGSSMGGYLAALYAARHDEVERVVLLAPAFGFARRWPATLGTEKLAEWRTSGSLDIYHYGEQRPVRLRYGLIEDGARYEDYPEVRQPALIFHGAHDDVVPVECSREFAASRANVRLEVVDSDHELLNVLDRMWEEIWQFCNSSRT
jgi:uncharacterized protein